MSVMSEVERSAILHDPGAIIHVVSALRKYRAAAKRLFAAQYSDGACDKIAMFDFAEAIGDAEMDLGCFGEEEK